MLFEALDVLQPHTDLLLLDHAYIGKTMVAALAQREIPFCMRVNAHLTGNASPHSLAAARPSAWWRWRRHTTRMPAISNWHAR
ncbi:hypothetical protein [Paraburkholderia sp. RL17-347-BIC-D]|uniref:hypothetical protein n=1 Tax=Paraburkholderia sp. RL17-347-BIC-D TaxID=3031632 RepID=UPI0038BA72E9